MKSGWLANRERKRPRRDNACPLLLPLINTLWTPPFGHNTRQHIAYMIVIGSQLNGRIMIIGHIIHIFQCGHESLTTTLRSVLWSVGLFVYRWDSLLNHSEPHTMPTCAGIKETPLHHWPDIKKPAHFHILIESNLKLALCMWIANGNDK